MIIGCVRVEFRQIVSADHSVLVAKPHIIHARFKLNEIVDVRSCIYRPVHVADNAIPRESFPGGFACQLFENFEHPILIESAIADVRFGVRAQLKLPSQAG